MEDEKPFFARVKNDYAEGGYINLDTFGELVLYAIQSHVQYKKRCIEIGTLNNPYFAEQLKKHHRNVYNLAKEYLEKYPEEAEGTLIPAAQGLSLKDCIEYWINTDPPKDENQLDLPSLEVEKSPQDQPPQDQFPPKTPYIYKDKTEIAMAALADLSHLNFEAVAGMIAAKRAIDKKGKMFVGVGFKKDIITALRPDADLVHPIDQQDQRIINAVGNLYVRAAAEGVKPIFNAADIIRVYEGLTATEEVNPKEIEDVVTRMNYLVNLTGVFDVANHYRLNGIKQSETVNLQEIYNNGIAERQTERPIIPAIIHRQIDKSGNVYTEWELLKPPPLYGYSKDVKQIRNVATPLLNLKKHISNAQHTLNIRDYLITRILGMIDPQTGKNKKTISDIIKLDSIFEKSGIDPQTISRKAKSDRVKNIRAILDHFKTTKDEEVIQEQKVISDKETTHEKEVIPANSTNEEIIQVKKTKYFIKDYKEIKGVRGTITGFKIIL